LMSRLVGFTTTSVLTVAGLAAALGTIATAHAQTLGVGENVTSGVGGISRFHAAGVDATKFPPSLALAKPMSVKTTGPVAADARVQPKFWTDADGRFGVKVNIDAGTSLYGTGEIAGPLLRNGRKTVAWNTDAYGYTEANDALYQSHPWVLAVRADGTAFGVLADTTWRVEMDLTGTPVSQSEDGQPGAGGSIVFRGEGAPFRVYVIDRASPQDVLKGLGELIGPMPLPPLWAIGYHQCRYSYYPEARVREIAEGFRSRKIPADVIWMDIDYMDEFRVFGFNKQHFPDPKKLNDDLDKIGFSNIWMINPGVKDEPGFWVNDQGDQKKVWVTNAAGETYRGEVWPGWCNFPDYTRPDVRSWWRGLYKDFMAQNIDGVWNDMNEPAVFNVKSKTMPEDNVHLGGEWDYGGVLPKGTHLQYHNVYGMLMAKGTKDGIMQARPEKRPFVLTRAGHLGSQRYAATWTGDNNATWEDVENSISMAANLGMSGAPFIGPDIGGFNGNGPQGATEAETKKIRAQHFGRWMGIGALLPFSRGHTGKGNIDKEPWMFGQETEQTCRLALERRYRLMPYLYTLFQEASVTNMPVLRPTFFADAKDPALRTEDDSFLLGEGLLVVAKTTPESDRVSAMPKGIWNPVMLVDEGFHPELPRLYVKGGSIIPLGPVMQWTGEKPLNPLTLLVSLDASGEAAGTLYEDAGDGFGYTKGDFRTTTYRAVKDGDAVKVDIAGVSGSRTAIPREMRVIILQGDKYWSGSATDGQSLTMNLTKVQPQTWNTARPPIPTN
jgi:alpha-glucosidase